MNRLLMITLVVIGLGVRPADAQQADSASKDEAALKEVSEAYVKAFNAADAAAVASFWSPEAVYTNRITKEQVVGRSAITEQFESLFKSVRGLKLAVNVDSLQFVSPNVAVEHGTAKFVRSDAEPEENRYSAVYVRHDGKWLLDRVTDKSSTVVKSHYDQLKELEWLTGAWMDKDENSRIVTKCKWTKNKNFLTRMFSVSLDDQIELSGMQIIGWDAAAKQIRSWTFDSDGGVAEGVWTKKGDRWHIRKQGTTADGKKATALNILTYVDDGVFKLQSVQRTLAGELLPNIDEVLVVRQ